MCKKVLCLNSVATENAGEKSKGSRHVCPNNQSRTESKVAIALHCASFVAMLRSTHCTVLQMNNSIRSFSAMNPYHFRKASGKPFRAVENQHLELSAKRTMNKEGQM